MEKGLLAPLSPLYQILRQTTVRVQGVQRDRKQGTLTRADLDGRILAWAHHMFELLGGKFEIRGTPPQSEPALLVGNHISYVDIPLLLAALPVSFVAKKQLETWPVFGSAARCIETVFVDREDKNSRQSAGAAIAPRIREGRRSVVVFPAGTTTTDESKAWRHGAFVIAKRYDIPIQPFRIRYQPLRPLAYLLEDHFVTHLWSLLRLPGFRATIEFHPPVAVEDPERDSQRWWAWVRQQ